MTEGNKGLITMDDRILNRNLHETTLLKQGIAILKRRGVPKALEEMKKKIEAGHPDVIQMGPSLVISNGIVSTGLAFEFDGNPKDLNCPHSELLVMAMLGTEDVFIVTSQGDLKWPEAEKVEATLDFAYRNPTRSGVTSQHGRDQARMANL